MERYRREMTQEIQGMRVSLKFMWHHRRLFHRPTLISALLCAVLGTFKDYGIFVPMADVAVVLTLMQVIGGFHAITVAWLLAKVLKEIVLTTDCVANNDEVAFRRLLRHRIPTLAHLLVGIMTMSLMLLTLVIPYESMWAGRLVVSLPAFVLVFYFEVATHLDNPVRAPWMVNRIPPEWIARIENNLPPLAVEAEKSEREE